MIRAIVDKPLTDIQDRTGQDRTEGKLLVEVVVVVEVMVLVLEGKLLWEVDGVSGGDGGNGGCGGSGGKLLLDVVLVLEGSYC